MKSIITSVSPYLCEKIVSGDCKIFVKKSTPKEVPFKDYIYCTKTKNKWSLCDYEGAYQNSEGEIVYAQQHVIGEFICDRVYNIDYLPKEYEGNPSQFSEFICNNSCLSFEQIMEYKKGKTLYSWHISDLKIYDKPKKLNEFKTPPCEKSEKACGNCKWLVKINTPDVYECECYVEDGRQITSPPRSWMYVEEIETR